MLGDAPRCRPHGRRAHEPKSGVLHDPEHAHVIAGDVRHQELTPVGAHYHGSLRGQVRVPVAGAACLVAARLGQTAVGLPSKGDHPVPRLVRLHPHPALHHAWCHHSPLSGTTNACKFRRRWVSLQRGEHNFDCDGSLLSCQVSPSTSRLVIYCLTAYRNETGENPCPACSIRAVPEPNHRRTSCQTQPVVLDDLQESRHDRAGFIDRFR